jgi:hypothetical protein
MIHFPYVKLPEGNQLVWICLGGLDPTSLDELLVVQGIYDEVVI